MIDQARESDKLKQDDEAHSGVADLAICGSIALLRHSAFLYFLGRCLENEVRRK